MDGYEGDPRIQLVRQSHQVFGIVEQGQDEDAEQADQDGHLDNQRPQAPDGVDAAFPIKPHGFLGRALPVAGVTLLDLAHPGLQRGHGAHLAQLAHRQRDGDHPNQHCEDDDSHSHLREADHVQHQQGVEHGPNDDLVPQQNEYGEEFH